MESFKVPNSELGATSVKNENWRSDAQDIAAHARKLPQSAAKLLSEDQIDAWATAAAKLSTPALANSVLTQSAGFGAKDIRTLIAHDRGEYYPKDSPSELYERKLLERVALPIGPNAERERMATRLAVRHIIDSYEVKPLVDVMKQMAQPDATRQDAWLIGRPALVAEKNGEKHIFHVDVSEKNASHVDPNDSIALTHYDLVAASMDHDVAHLHLVKVQMNPVFLDALALAAKTSREADRNLIAGASALFAESGDNLRVQTHQINKDPALYEEVVGAGRNHWGKIMRGERPSVNMDPPLRLDPAAEAKYTALSKDFVAASQIAAQAEDQARVAAGALTAYMRDMGVEENFTAPYNGSNFKKRDRFNAEDAASFLEQQFGVDPAHTRTASINVQRLQNAYLQTGGDISVFQEHTAPNRKKIETVAHDMGVSLEGFYEREMVVFVNPKTRGPIYEALSDIKDSIKGPVSELRQTLSESPVMDQQALIDASTQQKPQQSTMKV